MEALAKIYEKLIKGDGDTISLKKNIIWAASNLCRGKPIPPYRRISAAMGIFAAALKDETLNEAFEDASWGLAYLMESGGKLNSI